MQPWAIAFKFSVVRTFRRQPHMRPAPVTRSMRQERCFSLTVQKSLYCEIRWSQSRDDRNEIEKLPRRDFKNSVKRQRVTVTTLQLVIKSTASKCVLVEKLRAKPEELTNG